MSSSPYTSTSTFGRTCYAAPADVMSVALGSRPHAPVAALRWLAGRGFPYHALQLHHEAGRMGRQDVVEWLEGMGCSGRCVGTWGLAGLWKRVGVPGAGVYVGWRARDW